MVINQSNPICPPETPSKGVHMLGCISRVRWRLHLCRKRLSNTMSIWCSAFRSFRGHIESQSAKAIPFAEFGTTAIKVKSGSRNVRFVIAAFSPHLALKTGLPNSGSEKESQEDAWAGGVVRSLQSDLIENYREYGHVSCIWKEESQIFSAVQTVWRRGRDSITAVSSKSW